MASIITAHDLNLWYGDFKALKGISLDVVLNVIPSNIVTAFGSNGAVLSSVFLAVAFSTLSLSAYLFRLSS